MKKFFSLFAAIFFAGSLMAETITITPSSGFKSSYGEGNFTLSEVVFAYAGACYTGKGTPTGYAGKQFIQLRKSGSGAGEVKNNTEVNLKSIVIATQNDKAFTLSVGTAADELSAAGDPVKTTGKYACKDADDKNTECDVTIYTFDVTGKKYFDLVNGGNAQYLAYITIEYEAAPAPAVATPSISGETQFLNSTEVTITCSTDGATIYYTTTESAKATPATSGDWMAYDNSNKPTFSATTTVWAAAKKDDTWSSVAQKTFTKVTPLTTIQAIFSAATTTATPTYITFSDEWVVTGVTSNGKTAYISDGTNGMILYNSSASIGLAVGNTLSGTVKRSLKLYNGAAELEGFTTEGLTKGTAAVPAVQEFDADGISELSGVNTGSLIKFTGACTTNNNKFYVAGVQLYNSLFAYSDPTAGKNYTVTGVYLQYNSTKEVMPRSADDIKEASGTSLDNTASETKAVKTIVNGQLIIEKAGVKYNVLGQTIR